MALTPGAVLNVTGSLTLPKFIRLAVVGKTTEANGTIKLMVNTMDFFCPLRAGGGSLLGFVNTFQAAFQGVYLDCLSDTYAMIHYVGKYLDNPLSIPITKPVTAPGTVATDRKASFNAGTIQKITEVPSRNFRGALHIGALPESFTTTDQLNVTGLAAYDALAASLDGMVVTGVSDGVDVFFPIIVSTTLSNLFASPSIVSYAPITGFETNAVVGTMLRRKQRTGV